MTPRYVLFSIYNAQWTSQAHGRNICHFSSSFNALGTKVGKVTTFSPVKISPDFFSPIRYTLSRNVSVHLYSNDKYSGKAN